MKETLIIAVTQKTYAISKDYVNSLPCSKHAARDPVVAYETCRNLRSVGCSIQKLVYLCVPYMHSATVFIFGRWSLLQPIMSSNTYSARDSYVKLKFESNVRDIPKQFTIFEFFILCISNNKYQVL